MSRLKLETHFLLDKKILEQLFSANVYSILDFLKADIKHVTRTTSLTHKDVLAIRKHLINKNSAVVQNGLNYYNDLIQKSALIPTGMKSLDELLKGGLRTGNIYEVCGLPACGKTRFTLALLKNVIQAFYHHVYYIDSKMNFCAKKMFQIFESDIISEAETGKLLSKILVKQINTTYDLINALYEIKNQLSNNLQLRLIIINSLPPLFYQNSDYVVNYGIMNDFVNVMNLLAKEFHVAFLVVNVVTVWYDGGFAEEKCHTEKLGLGRYWSNIPQIRLMLKKSDKCNEYQITLSYAFDYVVTLWEIWNKLLEDQYKRRINNVVVPSINNLLNYNRYFQNSHKVC